MDRACVHGVFRTLAEGISPIFSGGGAEMREIENENQKKSKLFLNKKSSNIKQKQMHSQLEYYFLRNS